MPSRTLLRVMAAFSKVVHTQLGIIALRDTPADDPALAPVHHRGQVTPSLFAEQKGRVGHPDRVAMLWLTQLFEQIGMVAEEVLAIGAPSV